MKALNLNSKKFGVRAYLALCSLSMSYLWRNHTRIDGSFQNKGFSWFLLLPILSFLNLFFDFTFEKY